MAPATTAVSVNPPPAPEQAKQQPHEFSLWAQASRAPWSGQQVARSTAAAAATGGTTASLQRCRGKRAESRPPALPTVQACPESGGAAPKEGLQQVVEKFGSDGQKELPGGWVRLHSLAAARRSRVGMWGARLVSSKPTPQGSCLSPAAGRLQRCSMDGTQQHLLPPSLPSLPSYPPQTRSALTSWRRPCTAGAPTTTPRAWTARARAAATASPLPRTTRRVRWREGRRAGPGCREGPRRRRRGTIVASPHPLPAGQGQGQRRRWPVRQTAHHPASPCVCAPQAS